MGAILDDGQEPNDAATAWLKAKGILGGWLKGVTTLKGGNGMAAVKTRLNK